MNNEHGFYHCASNKQLFFINIMLSKKALFVICSISVLFTFLLWKQTKFSMVTKHKDPTMSSTQTYLVSTKTDRVFSKLIDDDDDDDYYSDDDDGFNPAINTSKRYFAQHSNFSVGFNISGSDVIVFLHIQKTGGTHFGHNLVQNLNISSKCEKMINRKRSHCQRPNNPNETWLISRYSTGWACGLHADWTNLKPCVPEVLAEMEGGWKPHRYFYITIIRDPVRRYVSEWSHVVRGATWWNSKYICNEKEHNIPKCYTGQDWQDVKMEEFLSCPFNLAHNRQTRMLANLTLVDCYDMWIDRNMLAEKRKDLEDILLKSAKDNLKAMSFFMLMERQEDSQLLFESTFGLEFIDDFYQGVPSKSSIYDVSEENLQMIKQRNQLDVQLYEYATELFNQRLKEYHTQVT